MDLDQEIEIGGGNRINGGVISPGGAHDMRERKVLNDNEWYGWVEWMRTCFRLGTIKESWKRIQENKWYDPAFEDFINKEVVAYVEREIR